MKKFSKVFSIYKNNMNKKLSERDFSLNKNSKQTDKFNFYKGK